MAVIGVVIVTSPGFFHAAQQPQHGQSQHSGTLTERQNWLRRAEDQALQQESKARRSIFVHIDSDRDFDSRSKADIVLIIGEGLNDESDAIRQLVVCLLLLSVFSCLAQEAMCLYEGQSPLRCTPIVIQGGYSNWYLHYPSFCTGM